MATPESGETPISPVEYLGHAVEALEALDSDAYTSEDVLRIQAAAIAAVEDCEQENIPGYDQLRAVQMQRTITERALEIAIGHDDDTRVAYFNLMHRSLSALYNNLAPKPESTPDQVPQQPAQTTIANTGAAKALPQAPTRRRQRRKPS